MAAGLAKAGADEDMAAGLAKAGAGAEDMGESLEIVADLICSGS